MNPFFLFFLIMLLPFAAAFIVLVPMHLALFAACYFIYAQTHQQAPIMEHRFDPFYLIEAYQRLLDYWLANMHSLPFIGYTLPLVVLPAATLLFALYICIRFLARVKEHFEQ